MKEILEEVLEEFEKLAAIPRPSGLEQKVGAYLRARLEALGAKVKVDDRGNVIGEVAATEGLENEPLVIMQAHMDMVCVSESVGYKYRSMVEGVKLKRDEEYLRAEGTSLGADDGIGIAIILYILRTVKAHTAWRIIFTTDEEMGMTGAKGLSEEYLKDAKYMINVDSEDVSEIVTGSAGHARIEYVRRIRWKEPQGEGYLIKLKGLKGGHSGMMINRKHINAAKVYSEILNRLECRLSYLQIGRAPNVIASTGRVAILMKEGSKEDVRRVCEEVAEECRKKYREPELEVKTRKVKLSRMMSEEDTKTVIKLMSILESGVISGRESADGSRSDRVSANIGIAKSTHSAFYLEYMTRFHTQKGFEKAQREAGKAYIESGCHEMNMKSYGGAWESKKDGLIECMRAVAEEQGFPRKLRVIHGGLECSHFIEKAPELEIVSIGTTNLDIHSTKERLLLSSIEPTVALIVGTLERLK